MSTPDLFDLLASEEPRLLKLPKWARDKFRQLCRRVEDHQADARDVRGDLGGPVQIERYHEDGRRPLTTFSAETRVAFVTGDHTDDFIEFWLADGGIQVMAGRSLRIGLEVSNTFRVELQDWDEPA